MLLQIMLSSLKMQIDSVAICFQLISCCLEAAVADADSCCFVDLIGFLF